MQFSTPVNIDSQGLRINHGNRILLAGSCFTENIGNMLTDSGFLTKVNPFGITYNAISIADCIETCLSGIELSEDDLVYGNGLWHSWQHHGSFSNAGKAACLEACNNAVSETHGFLKDTDTLILTLGTSTVYQLAGSDTIVNNCHKFPAAGFKKRLATLEEQKTRYTELIRLLKTQNPDIRIIFTISPIRHWRDGYRENQVSKSILHMLVHELQNGFGNIFYFPAYEILMDELRDYRFYDSDMLHPSPVAVEYIWEKFTGAYFDDTTMNLVKEVGQWRKMSRHRPLFPESEEYARFLDKLQTLEDNLSEKLPHLFGK